MPFRPCVSGCGRYLAPGDGHDRCLSCLGIEHAEAAFVDESCPHCGGMTVAGLRTRLRFLQRGGVPVPLPRSRVPPGGYRGEATSGSSRAGLTVTVRNSPSTARAPPVTGTSLPMELPRERAGPSHGGGVPLVSFGAPPDDRMSIATLEGESDQSGDDGSVPLPPSGRSAVPDSDPEMVAMLARAAVLGSSGRLHRVPNPQGWTIGFSGWPALVLRAPPRCLSSRKCMMSSLEHGRHLSLPETAPVAHPPSPPLTAERRGGIRRSRRWSDRLRCNCVQGPLLPGAVIRCSPPGPVGTRRPWPAVPMRPAEKLLQPYTLWRCCRFTRPRHWGTCTRVVTTQEFSVSFGPPRTSRYERRRLRRGLWAVRCPPWWSRNATFWLCLADMKEVDKARFLNAPVSQTGLFGDAVENFAQQFSAAQKQTEAIRHILPRRAAAASTRPPAAVPRPPAAAAAPAPAQQTQQPPAKQRRGAGRRAAAPPVQAPAKPGGKRRSKRPWDGRPRDGDVCSSGDGERTTPSPGGGPGGESFVSFFATGLTVSGTQNLGKRAVSSISGSPEGTGGCERVKLELHSPSSLASGQLWAVREGGQSHYSRTLCQNAGKCVTHADPASDRQRDARAGSLRSPSLPHRGYVSGFVGVTSTVLGGLANAPQPVSLAPPYHQTRLCDSVRPATSQVSRHPLHHSEGSGCPHLASRNRSPTGEGRDRAGPSSRYEVGVLQPLLHCTQEKRWVKTNLGSARFEPGPSQAPVQNAHTETHLWVRPSPRLVCSDRPEGRVLPRVDPSAPQAIPAVCVRRTGISVQSPALRAVPVAPCLHESSGGSPCSPERTGRAHSQLPRRLAYTSSVAGPVMRTQGHGALAPQPVGPSGQLGKEQTLPGAEDLFSRYGVRLGQSDSAPHAGTRSVGVELLEYIQEQDGGTTETVFRGSWGIWRLRRRSRRWGCSIWDRFNTGSMAESRGGRGRAARWGSKSLQPAAKPSPRGQTFHSFGQECPWNRSPGTLWFTQTPPPRAGGATFNGHAVSGVWTDPQLHWHINCLELLAVHLALNRLKRRLRGEHVLVRTDNTATVAYINRQGGLRSRRMSQLARHLLLWSRKHLRSLRAIHIPGLLNRTADELSRAALPGEWRLHPQTVQLIWRRFGLAQVDLFASLETSHCQLFYSLTDGTLGTDALAHSWPRGLRKYAFPPVSLLAQTLCKVREEEEQILLVAPYWPTRTWFPELMLLVTAPPWQIPLRKDLLTQRRGTLWHPRPDLWKLHVWSLDGTRRF